MNKQFIKSHRLHAIYELSGRYANFYHLPGVEQYKITEKAKQAMSGFYAIMAGDIISPPPTLNKIFKEFHARVDYYGGKLDILDDMTGKPLYITFY